jgi:hypothetical protein
MGWLSCLDPPSISTSSEWGDEQYTAESSPMNRYTHINTEMRACLQSVIMLNVPSCILVQMLKMSIIISVFI